MQRLKQMFFHSVMNYINLSLFTIVGIALISIFFSFWITDNTDNDAKAINLSGSMRMQTFHIGMAMVDSQKDVPGLIRRLDSTWNDPLFAHLQTEQASQAMSEVFDRGYHHWTHVAKPALTKALAESERNPDLYHLLSHQVELTDALVNRLQLEAERKIRNLRTLQLFSLLITTLVGSLIFYLLKNRVEGPLSTLTEAAIDIGEGNFEKRIKATGDDELALLGKAFNQMSASISETYNELEERVAERTTALQRQNTLLEFLFRVAREVLDDQHSGLDYHGVVKELSQILQNDNLELCLFTPQGKQPYFQIDACADNVPCQKSSCIDCKGEAPFDAVKPLGFSHKYPVIQNEQQYGVLQMRVDQAEQLPAWQDKLLRSTADQFAIALSLQETKDKEHRLAMMNERTVIARELHDSLAQSLSYLQIQVTRLQKTKDKGKYEAQQAIIDELREGLSSAYRHLRELLTTFRLKMESEGLQGAIEQTVAQLQERSGMQVDLNYGLQNLPLNPMEEIHLLQITREASQNAINHSQGEHLKIELLQHEDKSIELVVMDDGVGLSDSPEKLNHYGLAIMQERSKHLNGSLKIEPSSPHGTRISLRFTPGYLSEAA